MSVRDITYDNSSVASQGLFHFDSSTADNNCRCWIGLYDLHPEVNGTLAETYAGGADASDRRGLIRCSVNPSVTQRLQFMINIDHVWVPGTSALESFSFVQMTSASGTAADHDKAIQLSMRNIWTVGDWSGTKYSKPLGGISTARQWPWQGLGGAGQQVQNFNYTPMDTVYTNVAKNYYSGHLQTDNLQIGTTWDSPQVISGTGSPAGVVSAVVGTLNLRIDGGTTTTLYVKESGTGTSGWVAK